MPTVLNHHLRPALVALATLAGLLLAPAGASASCEMMTSAEGCSPSMAACCCSRPVDAYPSADDRTRSEVETVVIHPERICPVAGSCSCESRPQVPAEPAPKPARVADEGRPDQGGASSVEIPDLIPSSPCPAGTRPSPAAGPPHVPLYLRNARFLI